MRGESSAYGRMSSKMTDTGFKVYNAMIIGQAIAKYFRSQNAWCFICGRHGHL